MNEIEKIEKNKTWTLVPRPKDKNVNGTKWVFKNKLNEDEQVLRNKAILTTLKKKALIIVRLSILLQYWTLLVYAAHKGFKVYQMDVKSSFFNSILDEEVYIDNQKDLLIQTKRT